MGAPQNNKVASIMENSLKTQQVYNLRTNGLGVPIKAIVLRQS
jgi:hypothetical protein